MQSMLNPKAQLINRSFAGDDKVYFRSNVIVEPMLWGWHAWAHLIAPLQHAMNIAFRQIPIVKSYIATPGIHTKAASNPDLAGGPYMDTPLSTMPEVRALLAATTEVCAPLIKLANDYLSFANLLRESEKGYSLEGTYRMIPSSLQGALELFYDPLDSPNIRILEEVLVRRQVNQHLQELFIRPANEDKRKFFISNPRIGVDGGLVLPLPFKDDRVNVLARARATGVRYAEIESLLVAGKGGLVDMETILTTQKPLGQSDKILAPSKDEIRIRYFGHACLLLETADVCVLIDPVVAWTPNAGDQRFTYYDLPERIDYAIVSHAHHDHFYIETLLQLRHKIGTIIVPSSNQGCIMDPSLKTILKMLAFENIVAVDMFDEIPLPGGRMLSLPFLGEHADLGIFSKQSIFVELHGKKLLFLVDSNALDLSVYRWLVQLTGPVDAVFIGMECQGAPLSWLYGPLMVTTISRRNDESRRLCSSKAERAAQVVEMINPRHVFIYAMGHEPFVGHLTGLIYDETSLQVKEALKLVAFCKSREMAVDYLNGSKELKLGK